MSTFLKVRGIGTSKHKFLEFAVLFFYFPSRNSIADLVYVSHESEIHLVESFQANLLIGNDIISPKAMVINFGKRTVLIGVCKVTIDVNTKQWGQFLAKRLFTCQESIISPRLKAMILLVRLLLPDN